MAVNYLIKKGHKKIAHFTGNENIINVIDRFRGYRDCLKENGIKVNENYIFKNGISKMEAGYKSAQGMLSCTDRPTAIFASGDLVAIGALNYFLEKGYKIPVDFSIIGYDNIKLTSVQSINLTTVNQPKYEMGVKSVEILFR